MLDDLNRGNVDPALLASARALPIGHYQPDMARLSRALDDLEFEQTFAAARPPYLTYQRLRAALTGYRDIQNHGGWRQLPAHTAILHPGDIGPAVVILRQRLAAIGEAVAGAGPPDLYDHELAEAVRRFRSNHYLATDGVVGPRTRIASNGPVGLRVGQIRVNLERARRLLHALPKSFVLVDTPLDLVRNLPWARAAGPRQLTPGARHCRRLVRCHGCTRPTELPYSPP